MHDFNREAIKSHRQSSKNPLYWTNNDVCEWLRTTDLEVSNMEPISCIVYIRANYTLYIYTTYKCCVLFQKHF